MLIDAHCHIDAYPEPELILEAGEAARVRTMAVSTSLSSYVRSRLLCRHHPQVQVALGLHPRRVGTGYDQWPEWQEMLEGVTLVGETGLDFKHGKEEEWAAQARTLGDIAEACRGRLLMLHSSCAEAEVWDILTAHRAKWVVWHDYRPEGPRSVLYRAIEAGHLLAVGPSAVENGAVQSRLRAIPREQVLTETNGPWSRPGTGDRAQALQEIVNRLAQAWRCTPQEAEAQVERNYDRVLADVTSAGSDAGRQTSAGGVA